MNRRGAKYLITVLILGGLAFALGVVYLLSRGISARSEPSAIEAAVARRLRSLAIPRDARDAQNPVQLDARVMAEAMEHFADHCAFCHGVDGSGNTSVGLGLYPKAPDMRQAQTQNLSDGEIFYIIHNGIRFTGMPAFGDESAEGGDEDSWKLVHFIRHLPSMTPEQLEQMEGMIPRSPAHRKEEEEIERFLRGEDETAEESHPNH